MSDDDNDRVQRLRRSRREAKESVEAEPDTDSEMSEPSERSETSESSETSKRPVKEEFEGVYMYVPPEMADEIGDLYKLLDVEYDGEFEKNRHFYPLLVRHGLESLDGLDSSKIQTLLDGLEAVDS